VLAGPDGLDPRQLHGHPAQRYTEALGAKIDGMRIGVLKQGFEAPTPRPTCCRW